MSEVKTVSPLLDGISVGNPMSEHHGVRCCPAIRDNTNKKYILKIISIPASQAQMDALLYAGAYKDPADVMEYFRQTGEKILEEAELLKKLSRLDGFLCYEDWNMQPIIRRRLGYEIFLLGSYKRSLSRFLKSHAVTQLEAMNLGLDLCAALSVCRSAGYLYVALKPSNVFVSEKKEYRIGDIGFVDLGALSYMALPEKHHSPYTPPELLDPMASINLTVDTYAVGMILYQIYNDGRLPFKGNRTTEEELTPPINADYELAEIIMKAIHTDPEQRWNDPKDMGKALAAYMQRNPVNNVPVTPYTPLDVKPEDIVVLPKKEKEVKEPEDLIQEPQPEVPAAPEAVTSVEEIISDEPELSDTAEVADESVSVDIEDAPVLGESVSAAIEDAPVQVESVSAAIEDAPVQEEPVSVDIEDIAEPEEVIQAVVEEVPETEDDIPQPEEIQPEEETAEEPETVALPQEAEAEPEETAVEAVEAAETDEIKEEIPDEPQPDTPPEDPEADGISLEVSKIIARADSIMEDDLEEAFSHPNIPDIADPFAFVKEDAEDFDHFDFPEEPFADEAKEAEVEQPPKKEKRKREKKFADPKYKRRRKRFVLILLALLMLGAAGSGAFWYYRNLYVQTIDSLMLTVDSDRITVAIDSEIDPSLLLVRCIDDTGKANTRGMTGTETTFTGLQPNSNYTIELDVTGFHKLTGHTSETCTTEATTKILSFTSAVGSEDGSLLLSFTVDGEEPKSWTLYYSADGEAEQRKTFSGHSVSVSGLTVGKSYTFRIDPGENIALGGETTLVTTATRMVQAEDISITSENGTDISVSWKAPGDLVVDSWDVRCYSSAGYDQQITTNDTNASFTGLDPALPYSVEITASGMTQSARTNITANPMNVTAWNVDESSIGKLKVSWDHTGEAPKDGWLLIYNLVGGEKRIVKCPKASAEIPSKVPGGVYQISLHIADGTTVFNSAHTHTVSAGAPFEKFNVTASKLAINLLKTPDQQNWRVENVDNSALTDTFASGEPISLAMRYPDTVYLLGSKIEILYVIEDAYGNIIPELVSSEQAYWNNIWNGGNAKNGELDIPKVPTAPGEYVLKLYIDGMAVTELNFTIQ